MGPGARDRLWRRRRRTRRARTGSHTRKGLAMGVVPQKPIERVQWYENRIDPWTTNTTAIGLVSADVTDITTKTSAARAAYDAQQVAIASAQNATQAFYDAVAAMSAAGAAAIQKIRAKAAMTGNS